VVIEMREDAIALALAHVKRSVSPRVNIQVDVEPEALSDASWKTLKGLSIIHIDRFQFVGDTTIVDVTTMDESYQNTASVTGQAHSSAAMRFAPAMPIP
jgi:hypothetical protein